MVGLPPYPFLYKILTYKIFKLVKIYILRDEIIKTDFVFLRLANFEERPEFFD